MFLQTDFPLGLLLWRRSVRLLLFAAWCAFSLAAGPNLLAQPAGDKEAIPSLDDLFSEKPKVEAPVGARWALIVCGHPGDEEHQELYAESVQGIANGLINRLRFSSENIRIQFGLLPEQDLSTVLPNATGGATREEIEADVADLRKQIQPDDTLWVIVLGHAHWDGRNCFLNVPGSDIHQDDFAMLFEGLKCRQQVFMMTTSVSGFFTRALSLKGRIVISATEADLETNETLFHAALADVLSDPPAMDEFDADSDSNISLFDLYVAVTRNIAQRYLGEMLLATEHALLDDNGDGRGTELQLDYLNEEQGGRATEDSKPPKIRPNSDGALATKTSLHFVMPEESPKEDAAETEAVETKPEGDKPVEGEPEEGEPEEAKPDEKPGETKSTDPQAESDDEG